MAGLAREERCRDLAGSAARLSGRPMYDATADQSRKLLGAPDVQTVKGCRDRAILALMLGRGFRRGDGVQGTTASGRSHEVPLLKTPRIRRRLPRQFPER